MCTFKWDPKKAKGGQSGQYVCRPFNFYVFPNSDIMDKEIVQFDTSSLKFLMSNNFDFNKLFREGLNYQRLSDVDKLRERIAREFNEAPQFNR